jgi:hypothetical protein
MVKRDDRANDMKHEHVPARDRAKDQLSAATSEVKQHAQTAARQVRETAEVALDRRKESTAADLNAVASSFRAAGRHLNEQHIEIAARCVDLAANQIDHAASYLRGHQLRDLQHDAEAFARRHPAIFLGATAAVGLLIGRFLRSSAERANLDRDDDFGGRTPDAGQGPLRSSRASASSFDRNESVGWEGWGAASREEGRRGELEGNLADMRQSVSAPDHLMPSRASSRPAAEGESC